VRGGRAGSYVRDGSVTATLRWRWSSSFGTRVEISSFFIGRRENSDCFVTAPHMDNWITGTK
jgi:hypothetical protein